MFKLFKILILFFYICDICSSKKSYYIEDSDFKKVSIEKYKVESSNILESLFEPTGLESNNLKKDESKNLRLKKKDQIKDEERFENWFDPSENSNQTKDGFNELQKETKDDSKIIDSEKKWRLVSTSFISESNLDDFELDNQIKTKSKNIDSPNIEIKLKKKLSFGEKDLKFKNKESKKKEKNYQISIKNNSSDKNFAKQKNKSLARNMKFKAKDAINSKKEDFNQNNQYNTTLNKRSFQTGASSFLSPKKIMLASMIPAMIRSLKQPSSQVTLIPTSSVILSQPKPLISYNIVKPPLLTQQVISQPVIDQPVVFHQPVIQQPIVQPIVQQPVIQKHSYRQQPIIVRPIHVVKTSNINFRPQQVAIPINDCDKQVMVQPMDQEDLNEDFVDDEVDMENNFDESSYTNEGYDNQSQMNIVPKMIKVEQKNQQMSSYVSNGQNQKVYSFITPSIPKKTTTVYKQTKMIPSITSVYSTTSYTPEHRTTVVETNHNLQAVSSLINSSRNRIFSKPAYSMKSVYQPTQKIIQEPIQFNNNLGSW